MIEKYILLLFALWVMIIGCKGQPTSFRRKPIISSGDTTTTSEPSIPAKTDVQLWLTTANKRAPFSRQNVSLQFSDTSEYFALIKGSAYLSSEQANTLKLELSYEPAPRRLTAVGVSYHGGENRMKL